MKNALADVPGASAHHQSKLDMVGKRIRIISNAGARDLRGLYLWEWFEFDFGVAMATLLVC